MSWKKAALLIAVGLFVVFNPVASGEFVKTCVAGLTAFFHAL